ncbi:MAG: hypothetical protein CME32_00870 [Gimesia sp.]|nr:hypothetical protein [Gimesia sp.]
MCKMVFLAQTYYMNAGCPPLGNIAIQEILKSLYLAIAHLLVTPPLISPYYPILTLAYTTAK